MAYRRRMSESSSIEIRPYRWEGIYAQFRDGGAEHDPALCADVRAPWMPDEERLILRCCEIIGVPDSYIYDDHFPPAEPETRGKHYQHNDFQWDTSNVPRQITADCRVPGKAQFQVQLTAADDCVDIHLGLRNERTEPMGPVDWAFCAIGLECPSLNDEEQERTYFFDGENLRSLREIAGTNRTWMHRVAGGDDFISVVHQPFPVGPVRAQESVVIVQGESGDYSAALGFQQSYACYASIGNLCFHADPSFGTLKPGEEKRMHGRLYLLQGTAHDALHRYQRDFGGKGSVCSDVQ